MNPRAIVQALLNSVQRGDFQKVKFLLSHDYEFCGTVGTSITGETWMGMNKNLKKACPNLDYHFHVERVDGLDGCVVKISAELKGTQSEVLDLTPLGLGVTLATNRSFVSPQEHSEVTIKDNKVASWVVKSTDGGGFIGVFGQLGIKVPAPQSALK